MGTSIKTNSHPKIGYRITKRFFDIFLSFIGIVLLIPLFIIVYIIVWATSKGPAIFKDKRVGKGNVDFGVFKFRTMKHDAEQNIDNYLTPEQKKQWLYERKVDNDPRVTKVGYFLRKASIDELPQLFNIFIGNMSFVGPRPISRFELEHGYSEEEIKILCSVKPGLTGSWQVYGRNISEFKSGERQALELNYVRDRSLWLDFKLFVLTIPAIFKHKGS